MQELKIRPITKDDYQQLFALIEKNRERLIQYFPKTTRAVVDINTAKKFAQSKVMQALRREQYFFVIESENSLNFIGSIILKNLDWSIPKGELAYFIDADFEGRGYTSDAVRWMTNHCFEKLQMQKLYIKIDPENAASRMVALKNGFVKEGYLKREFRTGHGTITDVERYGLLRK
jgi:ribosomal-protein-serine acetyltransferase